MKELMPKISFVFLLLVVASLPTFRHFTPILIVLFALSSLIHAVINKAFDITNKKVFYTGIAFFAMHLISVIYSEHKAIAWFDIEVKMSLLIFPLLFSITNKYISENIKYIFYSFSIATVLANIYLLTIGLYNAEIVSVFNLTEAEIWRFSSSNLAKYIHPSYLSMYNLFVLVYIVHMIINDKKAIRFILILPALFIVLIIFLLQAKAGFLAFGFSVIYFTVLIYNKIQSKTIKYILPLVILLSSGFAISQNHRMRLMFSSLVDIAKTGDSTTSSTGTRFEIWKVTVGIISNNVLLGVGAGDIKPELNKKYEENPTFLKEATDRHLNVHNQYLETWLGQGVIGLSLLLSLFVMLIIKAYKHKDHVIALFVINIMVNFFPEAMLNNMHGVVFFALFYYLFSLVNPYPSSKNTY